MELHKSELQNAGLQIVAVGQGEPKHIVRYCHKIVPGVDCLVRDDTTAYRAYGIHRAGFKETFSLDMAKSAIRAASRGHIQGETTGDTAMKPATFIVGVDGLIHYTYYSTFHGDNPPIEDLVKVARQLKQP